MEERGGGGGEVSGLVGDLIERLLRFESFMTISPWRG
jgi:hypothetical protein